MQLIKSIFEKYLTKNKILFNINETDFYVEIEYKNKDKTLDLSFLSGLWKIIRESPFSKNKKIHTSFCKVEILDYKTKYIPKIEDKDLRWDFFKSSGPGGQNKNKTLTAVRLTHVPLGLVVISSNQRSQNDNKKQALVQLEESMLEKLNIFERSEKRDKWNSLELDLTPNISLYFNHHICSSERSGQKSSDLNGFVNGNIFILK